MWNNYFFQLQKKYNMRVSTKQPLVIRLDGKNVTKDKSINLFYVYKGSFMDSFKKAAMFFAKKYHCYAIFGSDEISFIFPNPMLLIEDLDSDKTTHSNEIIALFVQYFYDYFNSFFKEQKVFWHGKCFSIPEGKINSYIKYRSGIIKNVMSTYFLIINNIKTGKIKLTEKIDECKKYKEYNSSGDIENGILYYDGNQLDLFEFINGNIKKIDIDEGEKNNNNTTKKETNNNFDIEFFDL